MPFDLRRRAMPMALAAVAVAAAILAARPGFPLPDYAARTGLDCRSCHFDPNGGGPRNDLGFQFARQRHDLIADPDPRWSSLEVTNRIGDALLVGTNSRLVYLGTRLKGNRAVQASTFFQMQGALDIVLQPHPNLAIVMVRDFGEFSGDVTRDLYGLIQDASGHYYVKAGRIRGTFGLRQDDHSAGTRGGFLNTSGGGGLLPYDPRAVESGIEGGIAAGGRMFSASLSNGGTAFANRAQAVSARLAAPVPLGRVGVSGYDNAEDGRRYSRWSAFGLAKMPGLPNLTVQGEVGFGTDDMGNGTKRNLMATYSQADYRISRAVVVRARYDFSDTFRSTPGFASERFAAEGEFTLVPFADLKFGYRQVVPETTPDEHQVLAMVHLYF